MVSPVSTGLLLYLSAFVFAWFGVPPSFFGVASVVSLFGAAPASFGLAFLVIPPLLSYLIHEHHLALVPCVRLVTGSDTCGLVDP